MPRAVVAVILLFALAIVGVWGFEAALENAGKNEIVANESFTPGNDTIVQLDDSGRSRAYYSHNVTVYDENDTLMDPGIDYRWFIGNGTIKSLPQGALAEDSTAKITYGYQLNTKDQQEFAALLSTIPQSIGLLAPALVFVLFLLVLRGS